MCDFGEEVLGETWMRWRARGKRGMIGGGKRTEKSEEGEENAGGEEASVEVDGEKDC